MSIFSSIAYQVQKYNLRNVKLPRVDGIIFSENSSDHWQHVTADGMNVLDLGFGRWGINKVEETSPVYFKSKNALKVIGVDGNKGEVEFFQNYFLENFNDESLFICKYINESGDIANLITKGLDALDLHELGVLQRAHEIQVVGAAGGHGNAHPLAVDFVDRLDG